MASPKASDELRMTEERHRLAEATTTEQPRDVAVVDETPPHRSGGGVTFAKSDETVMNVFSIESQIPTDHAAGSTQSRRSSGHGVAASATVGKTRSKRMTRVTSTVSRGANRVTRMFTRSRGPAQSMKRQPPSGNPNNPQDYIWLDNPIKTIASNRGHTMGCMDASNQAPFTPLFFVYGACPNMLCEMQVVMFCLSAKGQIDFWWVKPQKGTMEVEQSTLNLNSKGAFKNDPGRSRPVYKPLADLFEQGQCYGGRSFGIENASAKNPCPRAYMETFAAGTVERVHLVGIWIEDWTSNPFARSKYIKGKLIYQKRIDFLRFTARQYHIVAGSTPEVAIWEDEDPSFEDMLPTVEVKLLWE